MPERTKIATCCYCGSRTMLTLAGRVQHQLACSSCGAPLSRMKAVRAAEAPQDPRPKKSRPLQQPARGLAPQRRRPRKRLFKRLIDGIEDLVEEIVDLVD